MYSAESEHHPGRLEKTGENVQNVRDLVTVDGGLELRSPPFVGGVRMNCVDFIRCATRGIHG